jgi:hypothetical protein
MTEMTCVAPDAHHWCRPLERRIATRGRALSLRPRLQRRQDRPSWDTLVGGATKMWEGVDQPPSGSGR